MNNEGISEINRLGLMDRESLDSLSINVTNSIQEGNYSAVKAMAAIKKIEYLISNIKTNIQDDFLHELNNHDKEFDEAGVKFTQGPVRTVYDYSACGHLRYDQVVSKLNNLTAEKKDIEKLLRSINPNSNLMDEEGTVLAPPKKSVTDGAKLSIK